MGSGFSHLFPCFDPGVNRPGKNTHQPDDVIFAASEPLDETLGHSFCYVRSSAHFLSPTPSDRFLSPTNSLRFSPSHEPANTVSGGFKAISGASVSANTSTPRTVLQLDNIYDDATDSTIVGCGVKSSIVNGFESTSSFSALPLQPVPRGGAGTDPDRAFFMSGPIERGALSGPLDPNHHLPGSDPGGGGRVPFSAPLGGGYAKRRRKKGMPGIRKAFSRNLEKKRWVVPVRNFVAGRKELAPADCESKRDNNNNSNGNSGSSSNVQWALGKAGEDRVHVVISEEHGWLFVGIYDGFNGPDAPEFLMGNVYKAMYTELEGLFWDSDVVNVANLENVDSVSGGVDRSIAVESQVGGNECDDEARLDRGSVKRVTFESEQIGGVRRRRLWEFLAEDDPEDGLDLSGSDRFAFSMDDALRVSNASRGSLLLSKLKQGLIRQKESAWKFGFEAKEKSEAENRVEERIRISESTSSRKRSKVGPVDHDSVLRAMSRALEVTELAYLDMTDKVLDQNPELALMGSCLLVALMRDEDVYVMNVGDSRAIVAQYEPEEINTSTWRVKGAGDSNGGSNAEDIVEESIEAGKRVNKVENEATTQAMRLTALQLSTDHSTSIEEEVVRIKSEHPDDSHCIVNDRVKGRLKVTRAFGAGFLKQAKWNDALLEMFRNEYIGTAPYISCSPSLRHHKLCPRDHFLVLSSDGLYQYLSNQEVVSHVESFMEKFPDGDPAQHLIEELLLRAAKKAGMDFHELLDIPQGDRRKYHDDVTVMVISLEGRIWKSSGKYL